MTFALFQILGKKCLTFCQSVGSFILFSWRVLLALRTKPDWQVLIRQMYSIGLLSLPVVLITGTFTGMVLTLQSYHQLHLFTLETLVSPIVSLSMFRELGPVLTSLMLASRVGAAITAEIGTMKVTEQLDAMVALAVEPIPYLVVPRFLSCVFLLPCLTIFSIFVGILGSYLMGVHCLNIPQVFFISNLRKFVQVSDIISGLTKTIVFGSIISLVSSYRGFHSTKGAQGVGIAVMKTVVSSSILILVSDFFLSVILF